MCVKNPLLRVTKEKGGFEKPIINPCPRRPLTAAYNGQLVINSLFINAIL